jgi:hypothetical protein
MKNTLLIHKTYDELIGFSRGRTGIAPWFSRGCGGFEAATHRLSSFPLVVMQIPLDGNKTTPFFSGRR